jgi:hypothetical protein
MADPNELAALKASLRGAVGTAAALQEMQPRIEALEPTADLAGDDLDALERVAIAHALASAALRGLVQTIRARRAAETA